MLNAKQLFRCMCAMAGMFPRLILSKKVDIIFIWGRAIDEWQATRFDDSVLKQAADFHRLTGACVAIPGYFGTEKGQGLTGYPGPKVWRSALTALGVSNDQIMETIGHGFNTKSEMDDFLELAVVKQWSIALAVTQQSHALRAMLGTVKSLADRNLQHLIVAPVWPPLFDWTRKCYGSQGDGPYARMHWIDEEFDRIPRYQKKGDLATLDELFEYIAQIHQRL